MDQQKYTFTWPNHLEYLRVMMRELMTSEDFADVTLLCDDKISIRAHRNILSACSPVLKDILLMSTQSNHPVIYLRGIQFSEIKSILQFMYLGEAKVYEERMTEFKHTIKDLEIKGLSKVDDSSDQQIGHAPNEATKESEEDYNESSENHSSGNDIIKGEEAEIVISNNGMQQTEDGINKISRKSKFEYKLCEKSLVWVHKKSKHEGVKYPFNQCDQQYTTQGCLTRHIQSKHEGVKYACNHCDH